MFVNTTRTDRLKVNFDFSFPEISCNLLAIDALDDTGLSQKDAVFTILKHKLSTSGVREGHPQRHEELGGILTEKQIIEMNKHSRLVANSTLPEADRCGHCYGAGTERFLRWTFA